MTGTDRTDTTKPLFAIGLPYAVTVAPMVTGGGVYTVADLEPAAVVPSGTTTTALGVVVADGDAVDGSVVEAQIQIIGAGGPGDGAGFAFRVNAGPNDRSEWDGADGAWSGWYGADAPWIPTGYQLIVDSTATLRHFDLCPMDGGRLMLAYSTATAVETRVRSAAGVWGSAVTATALVTTDPCALWRGFDGAYYVMAAKPKPGVVAGTYTMRIARSGNDGATWTVQTYDAGIAVSHGNDRRLRVAVTRGSIVAFVTTGAGAASVVRQYASTDGVNFSLVSTTAAGCSVWDARVFGNVIYALTVEDVSATDQLCCRSIGAASASLWDGTRVAILPWDHDDGACLATREADSALFVVAQNSATPDTTYTMSRDRGATWSIGTLSNMASTMPTPGIPTATFWRGALVGVGTNGDATVAVERLYGGHTQAPISGAMESWGSVWYPSDTLSDGGWSYTATGTPTLAMSPATGQSITTGAGESVDYTDTLGANTNPGVFRTVLRPASLGGSTRLILTASNAQIEIEINLTGIRAYDAGGSAPAYTPFNFIGSDYVDVIAVVDPANARAFVAYGPESLGDRRTYHDLPALTGLTAVGGTDIAQSIRVGASTQVYVKWTALGQAAETGLGNGWTRPSELEPIPLSSAAAYMAGGMAVKLTGGIPTIDGVTHAVALTSPYRVEAALPRVLPTPATGWKSDGLQDESLTLTLDEPDAPGLVAIDLHGLIAVSKISVNGTAVDLAQPFAYDGTSTRAVVPSRSGSAAPMAWVRADELRGWRFKTAGGVVRRVTGNSEGSLTGGATIGEHRAVIYLDGASDAVAMGSGVLYPARAILYGFYSVATVISQVTLAIVSADQYGGATPDTTDREIALIGVFRMHVLGIGADLSDTIATRDDSETQTLPNGQRYSARRASDGRTYECAWMLSPHATRFQSGTSTSPDYITHYTGSGPIATWQGVPLTARGIVDRARGDGRDCPDLVCLAAPSITRRGSVGITAKVWGIDEIYGRIMGPLRVEHLPYAESRIARVATVTVEAER